MALGPMFSRANFEELKRAQRLIHDLLPIIDDAEACGEDCEAWRAILRQTAADLQEIERRFMTPAPEA